MLGDIDPLPHSMLLFLHPLIIPSSVIYCSCFIMSIVILMPGPRPRSGAGCEAVAHSSHWLVGTCAKSAKSANDGRCEEWAASTASKEAQATPRPLSARPSVLYGLGNHGIYLAPLSRVVPCGMALILAHGTASLERTASARL